MHRQPDIPQSAPVFEPSRESSSRFSPPSRAPLVPQPGIRSSSGYRRRRASSWMHRSDRARSWPGWHDVPVGVAQFDSAGDHIRSVWPCLDCHIGHEQSSLWCDLPPDVPQTVWLLGQFSVPSRRGATKFECRLRAPEADPAVHTLAVAAAAAG